VEWVPRKENAFADKLSKLLIMADWILAPKVFENLVVITMAVLMFKGK